MEQKDDTSLGTAPQEPTVKVNLQATNQERLDVVLKIQLIDEKIKDIEDRKIADLNKTLERHQSKIDRLEDKISSCIPDWALNIVIAIAAALIGVLVALAFQGSGSPPSIMILK